MEATTELTKPREINILFVFLLLLIFHFLFLYNINTNIITEDILYYHFKGQMAPDEIEKLIDNKRSWLSYVVIPARLIVKILAISICISAGYFTANYKIDFGTILKAVVKAEFVFLLPIAAMQIWFGFVNTDYTLEDIMNFDSLALINLFDPKDLDAWMVYLFKSVNMYEVIYILVLAFLLTQKTENPFMRTFKVVLAAYGVSLFLWTTFRVFLIVTMT